MRIRVAARWRVLGAGILTALVLATTGGRPQVRAQALESIQHDGDLARAAVVGAALEQGLDHVPGEVLVRFRSGVTTLQQTLALRSVGADLSPSYGRWIGDTLLLNGLPADDTSRAVSALGQRPEVEWVQPNYIQHLHAVPNDGGYATRQWNMDQINMPKAWDINTGAGQGVTVAVIDSGLTNYEGTLGVRMPVPPSGVVFRVFSVPFSRPVDFDYGKVTTGTEFTPTGPWRVGSQRLVFDATGHGTHVAGTVAQQTNNSLGFAGVSYGATLLPIKACFGTMDWVFLWGAISTFPGTLADGCVTSDVIQAIRFAADNGANVINMSLGAPVPSPATLEAIRYAVSKGVFVAMSAGNEALAGNPTEYPAAYGPSVDGAVAVAATTPRKTRALYSSFGSYVELAAPGGEGSVSGCGSDSEVIWQVAPFSSDVRLVPPRFDRYFQIGTCGTSMASPHVAGAAALLYSQGIKNPAAIEAALKRFAVDLGSGGNDSQFGSGLIDVRAALRGLGAAR